MQDPPETTELLTFVRTVGARSISRAAKELGLPRPTVGRRLARLEEKLGVRLLRRTTRTMALTDAGETFYTQARAVLAAVQDAENSVRKRDGAVRGLLRVSTPPIPGDSYGRFLADFLQRYPEVRIEHHSTTALVDLANGACDVALRAGLTLAPGLIARKLSRSRLVAVASPKYLERHPAPRKVNELQQHSCLGSFALGEHPTTHWPLLRGGRVRVEPRLASNELEVLRQAALKHQGIAMLPLAPVYDDLKESRLVPVLADRLGGETHIAVVYQDREFVSPVVRAFVDALVRWAQEDPVLSRPMPECNQEHKKERKKASTKKKSTAAKTRVK